MKSLRRSWMIAVLAPAIAAAQPTEPAAPAEPAPPMPTPTEPTPPAPTPEPDPVGPAVEELPTDAGSQPTFADPAHHKLALELELFGAGAYVDRTGPSISELRLERGELGTTIGLGEDAGAELRLESLRSAGSGGALGIAGDSIVMRVKRAQLFGDYDVNPRDRHGVVHLHAAAGITPDPWITALETDYPLRPLSAVASERALGWPTSDLAVLGRVGYGPVRLSVSVGNGEGLDYPERNNGKTTTAVIEALPFATAATRLRLAAVGRDGSVGPARVRDHRFGGAATLWTPMLSAGAELVQAYGIADRGDLEALSIAGWAEVRPISRLALVGRATTIGYANGGGRASSFGGALAIDAWRGETGLHVQRAQEYDCVSVGSRRSACLADDVAVDGPYHRPPSPRPLGNLRLWLAADHTTSSGAAMPLPGADAGTSTTLLLIVSTTAPFTID